MPAYLESMHASLAKKPFGEGHITDGASACRIDERSNVTISELRK